MLYVVAWPLIGEADDSTLRRLRAQYHPSEAAMIGPHFTLVFAASNQREAELREGLDSIEHRAFWFMIERIVRVDLHLYAEPSDGAAELNDLHERLDPLPAREAFLPHITLGVFERGAEAEQIARIVERQHLPIRGRVEELALLRRDGDRLETLATRRLGN